LLSPRNGVIKSIAIIVGDSVIKGDLLIEFE
jgi:biotin carboxyl carrier protein